MEIRQFRVVVRARSFERTCRFYGQTLSLPRLQSWDRERDESFDYQGPHHKLVLVMLVPSAEKAYEELLQRDRNIPGGLRQDGDGCLIFDTHDPDGVRIVFKQLG